MRRLMLLFLLLLTPGLAFAQNRTYIPADGSMPTLVATVELTAGELAALSGGTKVAIPARPGKMLIPRLVLFSKAAGTAYTLNGVTHINLTWVNAAGTICAATSVTGLMDTTAVAHAAAIAPNSSSGHYSVVTAAIVAAATGAQIVVTRQGGTDLSAGTGGLTIRIYYEVLSVP